MESLTVKSPVAERAAKRRAEWEAQRRAEIEEQLKSGLITAKEAAELLQD